MLYCSSCPLLLLHLNAYQSLHHAPYSTNIIARSLARSSSSCCCCCPDNLRYLLDKYLSRLLIFLFCLPFICFLYSICYRTAYKYYYTTLGLLLLLLPLFFSFISFDLNSHEHIEIKSTSFCSFL